MPHSYMPAILRRSERESVPLVGGVYLCGEVAEGGLLPWRGGLGGEGAGMSGERHFLMSLVSLGRWNIVTSIHLS
jgi:hypothetical protein